MAAGAWKDWAQGELVTEALFQDIQDSIAFIYASESAANTALTNKVEGTQFYDTTNDALNFLPDDVYLVTHDRILLAFSLLLGINVEKFILVFVDFELWDQKSTLPEKLL